MPWRLFALVTAVAFAAIAILTAFEVHSQNRRFFQKVSNIGNYPLYPVLTDSDIQKFESGELSEADLFNKYLYGYYVQLSHDNPYDNTIGRTSALYTADGKTIRLPQQYFAFYISQVYDATDMMDRTDKTDRTVVYTTVTGKPVNYQDIYYAPVDDDMYAELMRLTEKTNLQNMTVAELVGMGRSPYTGFWGRLSAEDRRKVDDALELVGIVPLRDRMVQTLSDGERQKVMIAKALAQETPVIFLDEPTAFLDYPSKVEILHLLHRLSREMGKTIFLSTHDLELALQIADQLWLMARGRGVTVGTPEDLALDGVLDTFFRRKGVAFEKQTGLYRIESEYRSAVRLSGDPVACEMVRKALRRDAIRADFDIETPVSVHAVINPDGKPSFTVSDASQRPSVPSGEVHSVAGLLDLLSEFRS